MTRLLAFAALLTGCATNPTPPPYCSNAAPCIVHHCITWPEAVKIAQARHAFTQTHRWTEMNGWERTR